MIGDLNLLAGRRSAESILSTARKSDISVSSPSPLPADYNRDSRDTARLCRATTDADSPPVDKAEHALQCCRSKRLPRSFLNGHCKGLALLRVLNGRIELLQNHLSDLVVNHYVESGFAQRLIGLGRLRRGLNGLIIVQR